MSPDSKNLEKLSLLASKLNDASDELNSIIRDLEDRLATMQIGVSCWLWSIHEEAQSDFSGEQDEANRPWFEAWDLGYAKIGDEWRLAARKYRYRYSTEPDQWDNYDTEDHTTLRVVPLVDAPRVVRAEMVDDFDKLLTALTEKVESFLKNVEEAKKIAR